LFSILIAYSAVRQEDVPTWISL